MPLRDVMTTGVLFARATDLTVDDIAYFFGHQANQSIPGSLGERLGVPWERQWHNCEWTGNQGAAGVLTAFCNDWYERLEQRASGRVCPCGLLRAESR